MIKICSALTKKGSQCKNKAKYENDGKLFCGTHYRPTGVVSTSGMSQFDKKMMQIFGSDLKCESSILVRDYISIYSVSKKEIWISGESASVSVDGGDNIALDEGTYVLLFNREVSLNVKEYNDANIKEYNDADVKESNDVDTDRVKETTIRYRGIFTITKRTGRTIVYDDWKKNDKLDLGDEWYSSREHDKYILDDPNEGPIADILKLIRSGKSVFITGEAGTGKSYNIGLLTRALDNYEKTSSTGVSSHNIGGRTIHSFSGLGVTNIRDFIQKLGIKVDGDKDSGVSSATINMRHYEKYLRYKTLYSMSGTIYTLQNSRRDGLSKREDIDMFIVILYKYIEFMYPSSRYSDRIKSVYDVCNKTIKGEVTEDRIHTVTKTHAKMSQDIGMKYLRIETSSMLQLDYYDQVLTRICNQMDRYRLYDPGYRINEVKHLIIDEVSMLSNYDMEMLDWQMRTIRNRMSEFMGGIVTIFVGDLLQLAPVRNKISTPDIVIDKDKNIRIDGVKMPDIGEWTFGDILKRKPNTRYRCSYVTKYTEWMRHVTVYTLTKNYRQSSDTVFKDILNDVRVGHVSDQCKRLLKERTVPDVEDSATVLYGRNSDCSERNLHCLDRLDAELFTYTAEYAVKYSRNTIIGTEQSVCMEYTPGVMDKKILNDSRRTLSFKIGAKVMLLQNLSIHHGLVNGALGTVTNLTHDSITVQFENIEIDVPKRAERIHESVENDKDTDRYIKTEIHMKQYPLILAYGITIHKSQGNTYDNMVISMTTNDIWNNDYGKAYVALSRCRTLQGLRILSKAIPFSRFEADKEIVSLYEYWKSKISVQ